MEAVLFDLDGTLLDIDLTRFLGRYFEALSVAIGEIVEPGRLGLAMQAVSDATDAMMRPHPKETNRVVFNREYKALTGVDLDEHEEVLERFYRERFPELADSAKPADGASEALSAARECGLRIAIATNPIFPAAAIEHRLNWAGIDATDADAVTTYEVMCACKPHAAYYRQTAQMLHVDPTACLMVGDDPVLDMAAADVGMSTFYVGSEAGANARYTGTLRDFVEFLPRLCGT